MLLFRRILTGIMLLVFFTLPSMSVLGQPPSGAALRFVHTIPGASPIDVYVGGVLTVSNLAFGEATEYINTEAGALDIKVTPNGASIALWEQTVEATVRTAYTLTATTQESDLSFAVYEDDFTPVPLGKTRFTVIHAIPDAPAIDVLLEDGNPVLQGIAYAQPATTGTLDIQILPYSMLIVPAGGTVTDAVVETGILPLSSGTSSMLLVYGTLEEPQFKILTAPTNAQEIGGFVRFVHGVADGPAVDIYINDTLAFILNASEAGRHDTDFISVPAGSYEVAIRAAGTQQDLATATVEVSEGDYLTAVALASEDGITPVVFNADLSVATPTEAWIRVINGSEAGATVSASLADGTFLADNLASGEAGEPVAIAPNAQEIVAGVTIDGGSNIFSLPSQTFYGGVFYDLLVIGGDLYPLQPVALAQSVGSAPGAEMMAEVPAEVTPEVVVEATEEVVEQQPEVVVEPAQAPTEAPVVEAPSQTASLPTDLPQGRVFNLNPDANLQLRLYPDSQAQSLARMPFGTVVAIVGREGELAPNQPATPIPPDYEYVDPASLLEEDEDLPRDETWLRVMYLTPDGGTITGWARADFIDVRDPEGQRIDLKEIETTAGNVPGTASNTTFDQPDAPRSEVTVEATNLNPDANLNIRRIPNADGDVLGTMLTGEVADFVGINPNQDWIYVSFANTQGCTVEGWASAEFLTYRFNDAPVEVAELLDRGLFTVLEGVQQVPDPVCTGAPVSAAEPTPIKDAIVATVALDPGANLNLRRDPAEISTVLVQVPSGTQVIVNGRSSDANWLEVTYESPQGTFDGWIAARLQTSAGTSTFVLLTLNGATFALEDVPLAEGQLDVTPSATTAPATVQPTVTPTVATNG